jgi:hypothetical protein
MIIIEPGKINQVLSSQLTRLFPGEQPQDAGPLTSHALTAIWRLPSLFSEVGKMGMIAFYAGLFIGILLGFLLSSLVAFSLAKPKAGTRSDPAEGCPQVNLLKP